MAEQASGAGLRDKWRRLAGDEGGKFQVGNIPFWESMWVASAQRVRDDNKYY